ncbi:MAG: cupin domain-containing protein [Rhizobiaceae bacterium]|nr:cupin domain-containing protein [Rhizobiaceae bacterium]
MSEADNKVELYQLDDPQGGIVRKLADGLSTQIFAGDLSMLSIVSIVPGAMGEMHQHPEEQWGVVLEGSATRYQGDIQFEIKKGDFYRTPPNVPHTMKGGPDGARVLDIFAPIRREYLKPGEGFGSSGD